MQNDVIDGYRLRTHLQTGQSSQVYEVVEVSSNRHFAMKLLLPEHAHNADSLAMLVHEASVGILLRHENIIRIVKLERNSDTPYFIMEFFPSGSLRSRMMNKQGDFIKEHIQSILKQSATGLAFMNASGWVHRDVKPDNMLVNSAGNLRLIDFAIAQRIPTGLARWLFRKKKPQGTRSYMSPEQIRGEILDGRADIYSFGCTAYELVTGRTPFRGKDAQELLNKQIYEKPMPPKSLNPEVTDELSDLILRTLAKKREDRPRDFHEVLMALRSMRVYKNQPITRPE